MPTKVITAYLNYINTNNKRPKNIDHFCKESRLVANKVMTDFKNIAEIEEAIWLNIINTTLNVMLNDPTYYEYMAREKILSFFYTLQEELKENKAFATQCFRRQYRGIGTPACLKLMRIKFIGYANSVLQEGKTTQEVSTRPIIDQYYADLLWQQVPLVINFFLKDRSEAYEQTDTLIEKSINLSFDIIGHTPLDGAIDLLRFLWQPKATK